MPQRSAFCLMIVAGDGVRLGGVPIGRLVGDDLHLRMLLQFVLEAGDGDLAGRGRRHALDDGDLAALAAAGAAHLGQFLAGGGADLVPVGADIGVAVVERLQVDLDDVDAGVHRLLHQLGVGLHLQRMEDQHVRLVGDQLIERLGADLHVPVGVAHDHRIAPFRGVLLQALVPGLRQVEAERQRHEADLLAVERLAGVLDLPFVELVGEHACGDRTRGQRQHARGAYVS